MGVDVVLYHKNYKNHKSIKTKCVKIKKIHVFKLVFVFKKNI